MYYQHTSNGITILRHNDDGSVSHIPVTEQNEDYRDYLAHVAAGGETQPYEGWVDPEAPLVPDEIIES